MTSVAKDRTSSRRNNHNQNHNNHHTPGVIMNYLMFYCLITRSRNINFFNEL